MGALCVMDSSPRTWSQDDHDSLTSLACAIAAAPECRPEFLAQRESVPPPSSKTALDLISDGFVTLDSNLACVNLNARAAEIYGRRPEELLGRTVQELFPEVAESSLHDALQRALSEGAVAEAEEFFEPWDRWIESRVYPHEGGVTVVFRDTTERRWETLLISGLERTLEGIARGLPRNVSLDSLARLVDDAAPGVTCSILLMDQDQLHLRHGAGPGLPEAYNRAVDGVAIGECVGSCGTAAHRREPVVVADINTDPLWADYRGLANDHGLRACWSYPILGATGDLLGTFAIYRRVTGEPKPYHLELVTHATNVARIAIEQERRRRELRASLERLELVQRGARAGLWEWNLQTDEVHVSTSWKALLGYADEELPSSFERWSETIHPADLTRLRSTAADHFEHAAAPIETELRAHHKDGTYRRLATRGVVIQDAAGQWTRLLCMNLDVTEARRVEARGRRLFESNLIGIHFADLQGGILGANDAFLELLGYSRDELSAGLLRWDRVTPAEFNERDRQALDGLRSHGVVEPFEKEFLRKDGSRVPVLLGAARVDGTSEAVAFALDLTARREAEKRARDLASDLERRVVARTAELSAANERLKEVDRIKSEFLATVSHELRTPLNSIIGFSDLLRRGVSGEINAEQKKQLDIVNESGKHLLGLIDDLLDLSRIEAGKLRLKHAEMCFGAVCAAVVEELRPLADLNGIALEIDPPAGSLPMVGDRRRLYQVLLNLVGNAIKFTDSGHVRLSAQARDGVLEVCVADTGIGIQPEHLDGLFEAFRQVDGSARRVYQGTGLGLHLCRKLLTAMEGRIWAESVFGEGSRFTFEVPTQLAEVAP